MIYILDNDTGYDTYTFFVESDADAGDLRTLFTTFDGIGTTVFLGMVPSIVWEAGERGAITVWEWFFHGEGGDRLRYCHLSGCPGSNKVIDCNCPSRPRVDAAIRLGLVGVEVNP